LFLSATVFLGVRGLLDEDSEGAGLCQAFALSLIIGWSNVSKAIDHTCNAILLDKVQYFQLSILQEWKNVIKHLFEI
jgi:hypothetical protein